MKRGKHLSLRPKTFDLLVLLVANAGQLVTKEQIWKKIWPGTHVEETNLTNAVASIRRAIGNKGVLTRPKYGYQFSYPVTSRPGVSARTLALFEEANALLPVRSPEALTRARNLYWICLADAPDFAPAWAWLGRCCRFLSKYGIDSESGMHLAEAAFQRALALDPDLISAHEFYAQLLCDRGETIEAMTRLVRIAAAHPDQARIYAALIQAFRYCGLLRESLAAYGRLLDLDASVQTSVPHTQFSLCNWAGVIDAVSSAAPANIRAYVDLAAWAALGQEAHARRLAQERLSASALPPLLTSLIESLLLTLDGDYLGVRQQFQRLTVSDAETSLYFARHLSRSGFGAEALALLRTAAGLGYCFSHLLDEDAWLTPLHRYSGFTEVRRAAKAIERKARTALSDSGYVVPGAQSEKNSGLPARILRTRR